MKGLRAIFVGFLSLVVTSCGYEFGTIPSSSSGAAYGKIIAVPVLHNDTFEPVVEKRVTEMVRRQFLQVAGMTLVNDVGAAPLVLSGRVAGYGLQTMSFGGNLQEQRVNLVASFKLEDTTNKKVLWQETVTTAAEFFQTADLAINRSRQDRATEEAAKMMAEYVVSRVLEGFEK